MISIYALSTMVEISDANVDGRPIPFFSSSRTRVASVKRPWGFDSLGLAFRDFQATAWPSLIPSASFHEASGDSSGSSDSLSSARASLDSFSSAIFHPRNKVRFHLASQGSSESSPSRSNRTVRPSPFAWAIID